MPARAQETAALGFKGQVHAVFTEEFTAEDGLHREPTASTLDVYDPAGYQLDSFVYKADGSLWAHTVYDRKGPQTSRVEVTGTAPFESHSEQNVFDAEGHVVETDIYDANGVLVSKSTYNLVQQAKTSIYQRTETTAQGAENITVISETTDPQTGLTHQVATKNGQADTDWVIQRNADGTEKDKIVYADGSYNESERRSDGTTVEDRYYAPGKSHTYQKSDARGHLIEVVEKSDSHYIRCTYSFDKEGRPTGQINYDASGNVLEKSTVEYQHDDSYGNWVEKKTIVWNTATEPMQPKIVGISLRTINYY
jgi:hypothetical protein